MNYKNWYLFRLYRHNKVMFGFVLLFIFFQLLFNYKRIHSFPWFVWDMYSRVESMPETLTQTEVFIDGERLDVSSIPIWQEATILHTFTVYNWQKMNHDNDPMDAVVRSRTRYFPESWYSYVSYKICNHAEETNTYPAWLKHYLEQRLHKKINTVEIKNVQYKYLDKKFVPLHSSWTVLKIEN